MEKDAKLIKLTTKLMLTQYKVDSARKALITAKNRTSQCEDAMIKAQDALNKHKLFSRDT